jgi:hypothetical protein
MSWCMRGSECPEGGDMVNGICETCGLPDSHEHYSKVMASNVHPVLRYAPPTLPPVGPPGPCGPGPLTEMERVVELGIRVYDATKEPIQLSRDIAVKGVFSGLRRLFYRRR